MDFLDTLETIRADHADVGRIFNGDDGQRAPSRRPGASPAYQRQLAEAVEFVADVMDGRRRPWQLQEAFTTSDFPILFGDILDRQMLATYREIIPTWQPIARRRVVRDFRGAKLLKPLIGLGGRLEPVGELAEYPEVTAEEQEPETITVAKMGKRLGISWETLVNDDLDQVSDLPRRMAQMARRTEAYMATELYVGTAGPHGTLYSVGNANIVNQTNAPGYPSAANNPALSIAALGQALQVFGNQVDEAGNPIDHEAVVLVVPPALEVTANNIMNATAIEVNTDGGTLTGLANSSGIERRLLVNNWMSRRLSVVVNPYIPLVADTNGNTSWFLFGAPGSDREALAMAFLRGWEEPAIFIKSPNAQRVGGGEVSPLDGDFDLDAVTYKVRHVLGSARVDPKATVASNGTGS